MGAAGESARHMAPVCVADDSVVILAPFLRRSCQLEPLLMSFPLSVRHLIGSGSVQLAIKARVWCLSVPQVWVIFLLYRVLQQTCVDVG